MMRTGMGFANSRISSTSEPCCSGFSISIDDGLDLRTQAFDRRGENPLLRSLRSRVCSGGSMKISHKPSMRASSLNSAWRLSGRDNNICCARFAESLGSFAVEEHSAWLTIDHTAHLPPTSR